MGTEPIYIFTKEDLGPAPILTTPSLLQAHLASLFKDQGWGPPPDILERKWERGEPASLVTEKGFLLAIPATLENLHSYEGVEDPAFLFWQAVAMALYDYICQHLDKLASYADLRQVKQLYEEVASDQECIGK